MALIFTFINRKQKLTARLELEKRNERKINFEERVEENSLRLILRFTIFLFVFSQTKHKPYTWFEANASQEP